LEQFKTYLKMKTLLKKQEKKKGSKQRSGATFRIDQALISKFGGTRKPTQWSSSA
jgi:hypothetical protein